MRRVLAGIVVGSWLAAISAAQGLPLDAAARRGVVDSLARLLETRYADPDAGARVVTRLRQRLAAGAYDRAASAGALAEALTTDLREATGDLHLRVSADAGGPGDGQPVIRRGPGGPPGSGAPRIQGGPVIVQGGPGPVDGARATRLARTNFQFRRAERLEGNVGYLAVDEFAPLAAARETAAAAMAFVSHADALIFDLRENRGGSPQTVDFLISYLFGEEPVKLMAMYDRPANDTMVRWTMPDVPGRRMPDVPAYVLVGPRTGSAAEDFAFVLKNLRRATLVGERTAGAGFAGGTLPIGAGLVAFVPESRPIGVATGGGWQGDGVAPDVAVPADSALGAALRLALERLASSATDSAVRRQSGWALAALTASPPALGELALAAYAGRFAAREVTVERGALMMRRALGLKVRLAPLAADLFRLDEDTRVRFERDAGGRVVALVIETSDGRRDRVERR